jgi:hypothetical protein
MDFNGLIDEALRRIKPETTIRIARDARPPSDYLFSQFLPNRNIQSYEVSSTNMTVRSTMAGLTAMDGLLPEGGVVEMSDFREKLAKLGIQFSFNEGQLRQMQDIVKNLLVQPNAPSPILAMVQNFLNATDKLLIQPLLDTEEWLRAQVLRTGAIDWTFNGLTLNVDYGFEAGSFYAQRTGNDGWGGSTSKFWTDIRKLNKDLNYNVAAYICHPDTLDMIISNSANNIEIVAQTDNSFSLRKIVAGVGGGEKLSTDFRDRTTLIAYGAEAEILDTANPGQTKNVKFMETGEIVAIGRNTARSFILTDGVDEGSTEDPNKNLPLGYCHIGPTIEGDGRAGRWSVIEKHPLRRTNIRGQAVENFLPVCEAVDKVKVASSVMV